MATDDARRAPAGRRPRGVTALGVFFALGGVVAATTFLALLFPALPLESMWRLNPRARVAFAGMGAWGPVLMATVATACGAAATGLWRLRPWGHRLAVALLAVSLLGDVANATVGAEPRAWVGVPIAGLLLAYLLRARVRGAFAAGDASASAIVN